VFHRKLINDMEHLARLNIDLDYEPDVPDYDFGGLTPYGSDLAWALWRAWEKHGVMPDAGGYLDQAPEWKRMIETLDAVYGVMVHEIRQEVNARKRDHS
jgi:hypothetical protein